MITPLPRGLDRLRLRRPRTRLRFDRRAWGQITCFSLIGLAVLVAGWQYSESSGKWQDAVRQELRQAFALQETVRRVYGEEAPLAFDLTVASSRVEGLREARSAGPGVMSEYVVATRTESQLRSRVTDGSLAAGSAYGTPASGHDVLRRLADGLADLPRLDPRETRTTADRHALAGAIAAWLGMGVALLAVVVALTRRRSTQPASDGIDLIPQPFLAAAGLRGPTALQLVSWFLLGVLPLSQLLLAAQEQQRQADAAVSATRISTAIFVSNQRNSFLNNSRQIVVRLEVEALARQFAALGTSAGTDSAAQQAVAEVDGKVARHVKEVAEAMGRPAHEGDRLDHTVVTALASQPGDWPSALQEQNRHVSLAEQASDRGLRIIMSTALAALASALAAAAAAGAPRGRRGRMIWTLVTLGASVAVAVSGVWV